MKNFDLKLNDTKWIVKHEHTSDPKQSNKFRGHLIDVEYMVYPEEMKSSEAYYLVSITINRIIETEDVKAMWESVRFFDEKGNETNIDNLPAQIMKAVRETTIHDGWEY